MQRESDREKQNFARCTIRRLAFNGRTVPNLKAASGGISHFALDEEPRAVINWREKGSKWEWERAVI